MFYDISSFWPNGMDYEAHPDSRRSYHRGETGRSASGIIPSKTHYKSLISLSEGTSERRDLEEDKEDYYRRDSDSGAS